MTRNENPRRDKALESGPEGSLTEDGDPFTSIQPSGRVRRGGLTA